MREMSARTPDARSPKAAGLATWDGRGWPWPPIPGTRKTMPMWRKAWGTVSQKNAV